MIAEMARCSGPRSFRIVWLDGNHIVTVGHGPGSSRQLKLFAIDFLSSASLSEVSRCPLDVSPALLFPHWDADTCILYLWSKGERIVHAYEIHPDQQQQQQQQRSDRAGLAVAAGQQQTWLQLPQFQHGEAQLGLDWLGKDSVDVKTVEVATSIRLCRTEAQRVGWKITRSRVSPPASSHLTEFPFPTDHPVLDLSDCSRSSSKTMCSRRRGCRGSRFSRRQSGSEAMTAGSTGLDYIRESLSSRMV